MWDNKYLERIGEERLNKQGCLMKIVVYNNTNNIIVEFQDRYRATAHTKYQAFIAGEVKNPYCPSVYGVGIVGNKYPLKVNGKETKEYVIWRGIIQRCYHQKCKEQHPTYKNVTCCDEWIYFENFYEWIHSQDNFDRWLNGERWAIDKDIICKGNKIYSPDTCCLVPMNVNSLFVRASLKKDRYPIGVTKQRGAFVSVCRNPLTNQKEYFGRHQSLIQAFLSYKNAKESYIKQVAKEEYNKGNITKKCYDAMMNYEVEIDD